MRTGLAGTGLPGSPTRRMLMPFFHSSGCLRTFSSAVRMASARVAMAPASRESIPVTWNCLEVETLVNGCLLAGCSSAPAAVLAEGEGGTTGFTLELPCNTGRSEASSIKSASWADADSSSVCRTSAEESLPGSFRSCPRPAGSRRRAVNRKTHVPLNFINGKS